MTILSEQLLETLTKYENLRDRYKVEIEHSPDGSLLHQTDNNKPQFLHSFNVNGKRIRKGIMNAGVIESIIQNEIIPRL